MHLLCGPFWWQQQCTGAMPRASPDTAGLVLISFFLGTTKMCSGTWRAAGSLSPITTDPCDEFAGRLICLKLIFTSFDSHGKCIKGKYISIALMSVYFPCNYRWHERFCTMFNSVLADINLNTQIIVGSDINACIGTWTSDEHKQVLGPYGIARSNSRGKNLVHILGSNDMQVENMFFNHTQEDYVTYTSIPTTFHPDGIPSMHDIFAYSQSLHKWIHDCKAVPHGAVSDHKAERLSIMLMSIKFCGHALSRGTINWPNILSDDHNHAMYKEHLLMLMTGPTQWDDHQELILQVGSLTATTHKRQCEGWFQMSHSTRAPLYTECNTLKHEVKNASHLPPAIQATMQSNLKHLTHHISHSVSHAKATWYADICQKIHDMRFDPRLAWEHIRLLTLYKRRNGASQQDDEHDNATPWRDQGDQRLRKHGSLRTSFSQCLQQSLPHRSHSSWTYFTTTCHVGTQWPHHLGRILTCSETAQEWESSWTNMCSSRSIQSHVQCQLTSYSQTCQWLLRQHCWPWTMALESMCASTKKRRPIGPEQMAWHHANGCRLKDFQLSHEQMSLQTPRHVRHQIPIWWHSRTWLLRWLIRTQNNAQSTKKSQSVAFVDLVKAFDTANHNILLDILDQQQLGPKNGTSCIWPCHPSDNNGSHMEENERRMGRETWIVVHSERFPMWSHHEHARCAWRAVLFAVEKY